MTAPHGPRGFAVLRHRDLGLFVGARFLSLVAAQMLIVAVGWQVYQMTGRVFDLGMIGLSQFLPFLCLALVAGHAADRHDRRLILIGCGLAQLLAAGLLLAFVLGRIAATWPIFAVLALLGIARAFQMPTGQSLLPNLVPTESFGSAVAIASTLSQVATIAGPSLGGILYASAEAHSTRGGAALVYSAAAALALLATAMIALLAPRAPAGRAVGQTWDGVLDGLRFVWRRKTVLGAMSLDLFAVLFGGATALLPAYTRDVLHGGPEVFGLLRTAPGIGAGLTALVLAFRPIRRRVGASMFGGVALFGAATVAFGLTHSLWIALPALLLMGAGDMVSIFVRALLVQLQTPERIRGRVSAVNSVFIGASNELGEFESGVTAAWLGLVPSIVAGGVLTLVVAGLWAGALFPPLRRLKSFADLEQP